MENISENYENRHLDSNGRTLKFKITDGFMIYQGIEEQKLNLNKIITRYKHSINGKPQPFNLNNLQKMKLLVKTGTIFRRNVLLFKDNNTTLLEEYDDLFVERMVPQMVNKMNQAANRNRIADEEIEEEAMVEEFMEFIDEL